MSSPKQVYSAKDELELMRFLWDPQVADDPYQFVMVAFPWGKAGTPLEHERGPRTWQREKLIQIRDFIKSQRAKTRQAPNLDDVLYEVFQDATVSGRGVGKSALVSWLILWFLTTRLGATVIVSANTEVQLSTKTWPEVSRWHTLLVNSHWFEKSSLAFIPAPWFKAAVEKRGISCGYYFARAILWSEEKPESFAGAHNPLGMMLIFDEASGIPPVIWQVSQGFFTEKKCPDRYWFCFSNGRRNTGTFFECFHKLRNFWRCTQIDARTVEGTDPTVYQQIVSQYGEDSDEARIEVYGEFPRAGDKQFISRGLVDEALARKVPDDIYAPLIMGVDPARFGGDSTVIRFRQGRNGKVIPPTKLKGKDNMEVANTIAHLISKYNPRAVNIDVGNGSGIIDRLREMGYRVNEVGFGRASPEPEWANFRTYIWNEMRKWLAEGMIDNDKHLIDDLTAPEYKFQGQSDRIRLETKEELKERGFSSPDDGDALACTFAVKVARDDLHLARGNKNRNQVGGVVDYDLFA